MMISIKNNDFNQLAKENQQCKTDKEACNLDFAKCEIEKNSFKLYLESSSSSSPDPSLTWRPIDTS